MLKSYLIALLTLAAFGLQGQSVLTTAYFPEVGDTLRYSRPAGTVAFDLPSGAAVDWNFGTIEVGEDFDQVVSAVPEDAAFPEADVMIRASDSTMSFYTVLDDAFSLIGISGDFEAIQAFDLSAPVVPPLPERHAPLAFGDTHTALSTVQTTVSVDSLPSTAIEEFGTVLNGVDSIRLTLSTDRRDIVDGYGTLTLNGRTYTVLRERRTEIMNNQIELQTGLLGFTNVTGLLAPLIPNFAEFFGQQPARTTYYFWSPDHKEAIATVTLDDDGNVEEMTFIRADVTNSVRGPFFGGGEVSLYPNPASRWATLTLEGIDPGGYTLRVVSVLGREVVRQPFTASAGSATLELDVSELPRGTYLYSVTNERGRILTTRRLLVGG